MFKIIPRNIVKLAVRCRRYATVYPKVALDETTQCTFLPNGIRIATEWTTSPLTCISMFVTLGPRYETCCNNGITHFIEHMAYKGFKSMSRLQLECEVGSHGARLDVKTYREMQIFSVLIPSHIATIGVRYLYSVIEDLCIDPYVLKDEKCKIYLEVLETEAEHKQTVFEYLHNTAFQGTPLANPVIAPYENQVKFNAVTLNSYVCENYTASRIILATSGGINSDKYTEEVGNILGSIKSSTDCAQDSGPCRFTASQVIFRNDSMHHAHVAIAVEAPGYTSPDYWTMIVMKCLIGQWDESIGRPMNQSFYVARNAGGAGSCQSYETFYIAYKDTGLWGTYFVAGRMDLDDMANFIQSAWMRMTVTCTSTECKKAVAIAKLKLAKRYEGVVNSSFDIGLQLLYTSSRLSYKTVCAKLDVVTPRKIREAGDKYIYNKSPVVAGVGPTENLSDYNRIESCNYWLRF